MLERLKQLSNDGIKLVVDNSEETAWVVKRGNIFIFDNNEYDHFEDTAQGMAQYLDKHKYRFIGYDK